MPPPDRINDDDYHFYVYDYLNSKPWKLSPTQPQRDYLRFYSMLSDMAGLLTTGQDNDVPNISMRRIGTPIIGDNVARYVVVLSFGGPSPPVAGTPEVLITGGIHAREWISPAMTYLLAEYLIINYTHHPQTPYQTALRNLIDQRRIHVLPLLNPNGNRYTVFTSGAAARLWRKNRRPIPSSAMSLCNQLWDANHVPHPPFQNVRVEHFMCNYDVPNYDPDNQIPPNPAHFVSQAILGDQVGVDLNRNFATAAYGYNCRPQYANYEPVSDDYFGTSAASELETQNIQQFLASRPAHSIETAIDYHSFGKMIIYPEESLYANGGLTANQRDLGEILQKLIAPSRTFPWSDNDYALGGTRELFGYDATGSVSDYAAQLHGARTFAIELDPARSDDPAGFELPERKIRGVFEKNIRAALALIVAAGQASNLQTECCFNRRTITSGERVFLDWDVYGRGNRLPA